MPNRPRLNHPEPPRALHLARLAAGTPGEWVALPGGLLRVLALKGKASGPAVSGWLTCLTGEALLDLPHGEFVRLRAAEGYRVTPEVPWEALPVKADTALLLVPDSPGM
ncbi:hypothetical protein E5F05_18225 [Deinococcus metallilatus]|uniref:Uncharacterized protein n=2 Tax=Deinococcus TaxID=1298 RepID=A0AAJ5F4X5_9DEIO|nr:hypothetical protein [Deinococcus metallilatus]MBB5296256.1 hypothetical protein [Deinococcus metallilatus]QBY09700.1 hypothetical protein E5F05_18225 [Deinococcus metallilatus]RXJ08898.1 hypothetical protein ERJ73_17060 [Deinococcus metallilatus]TLK23723.1 hypothetical protein FCS05_16020 [Deinococcus metallilatus]GMA14121.1 hypothetical protein GCM10025871_04520 [Deinococcus metallilatus]